MIAPSKEFPEEFLAFIPLHICIYPFYSQKMEHFIKANYLIINKLTHSQDFPNHLFFPAQCLNEY